jgi:hypothetical protein
MTAGNPPPSSVPDTASARGVVRDALGGFQNLLGLLRSMRVGPQAVSAVIPDVHASCAPMIRALQILLSDIPEACRDALGSFLMPEANAVERALSKARGRTMRAKDRLQVERALSRAVRGIEIGFRLLALQHASRHVRPVPVDVAELATEEGALVTPSPTATRALKLAVPESGTTVLVDPRLTAAMLALAAGLVRPAGPGGALRLDVTQSGDRVTLRLSACSSPNGKSFTVLEPVAPTRACLEALATSLDCLMTITPTHVEIAVPAAPLP